MNEPNEAERAWAKDQRALARALGLSIEEWLLALEAAGQRTTGLTAAVIGAAMAKGLGLSVLDGLDGPGLAKAARGLIDPTPPRVENPVLKEAIRRADDVPSGRGAALLGSKSRAKTEKAPVPTPRRGASSIGDSANFGTADAPGAGPAPQATRKRRQEEEE